MYLSFYKLTEKPFSISTDPRFLWYGEKHGEALANLKYGLMEGNGYVVLTGDAGTGKTTLVNALIESMDDNVIVANINHPTFSALELLNFVAKTFDSASAIACKADCLFFFKSFLHRTHVDGKTALLLIDEAHRLPTDSLEEIRLLSNIEQAGKKLINIVLVGQNELKLTLFSPECYALRQRITLFYDIRPLSEAESWDYVAHRLKVAGTEEQLFTSGAIHQIYNFTRGYPRLINIICDRAMLTGYAKNQKEIDSDIVSECARELSLLDPTKSMNEAIKIDNFYRRGPLPVAGLSTQALDLNNSDRGELTAQSVRYPTEIDTIVADQTAASPLVKKKLRKLMSTGLIAAIVLVAVAVAVGIGVKTVSYFKTVASINVDRTAPEEKAGVPPRHAAVAVPQQPTDNTVSASETPVPDVLKAVPQMLKQKPAEEIIDSDKKSAPANPMPTVVSSPLPGIKPFPEAKPKIQNKPTTKGFADLTPNKTSRAFQPTTLELASAALKQQNFKMAIELLEADRSRDARNSQKTKELYSKALVGQAGRTMKKSPSEAEGLLRIAVENDPGNVRAHFNLGKVYTQTKVYALAIDAYQKAVTLNPNFSDAIFNLGFIYAETGKYKEAEKLFARVVRLKPSYLDKALFNLAMVQEKLGKEKESLAILQKAAAVRPENQKVRAYLKQAENGVKESP